MLSMLISIAGFVQVRSRRFQRRARDRGDSGDHSPRTRPRRTSGRDLRSVRQTDQQQPESGSGCKALAPPLSSRRRFSTGKIIF